MDFNKRTTTTTTTKNNNSPIKESNKSAKQLLQQQQQNKTINKNVEQSDNNYKQPPPHYSSQSSIVSNSNGVNNVSENNCSSVASMPQSSNNGVSGGGGLDDPETIKSIKKSEDECEEEEENSAVIVENNVKENNLLLSEDCEKPKSNYNDFVNLLCANNDVTGLRRSSSSSSLVYKFENKSNGNNDDDENQFDPNVNFTNEAIKHIKAKPKSIVKSPSTKSFANDIVTADAFDNGRPVLHVQFENYNSELPPFYGIGKPKECSSPTSSISTSSPGRHPGRSSSSSSSSSEEEGEYSEAKPPDGGWGWVVVFASFFVNLIADGITFSFGVLYVEFLDYFGEGKSKTAWIGSLFMAMPLLSGPIASYLTDRYGCRKVTIAGSILASIGFVISAFTTSMEMLYLTFGIFAGFGLSLCYVAAVVIVAYYFDKRRSFATGLSVCGSGIGTFIFAPLTQLLLENYGWRGTTLILAGFFLNMTVCGMLMRDLEWTTHRAKLRAKQKKKNKLGISADSFSVSNSTNTGGTASNLNQQPFNIGEHDISIINKTDSIADPRLFRSLITLPTFLRNGEKVPVEVLELMSTHRNVQNVLLQNYPGLAHSRSFSEPLSTSRHSNSGLSPEATLSPTNPERIRRERSKNHQIQNEQAFLTWLKRDGSQHHKDIRHPTSAYLKDIKMHRHSLTYRGAMLNINRYRLRASSCPDIYRNSMTTIAKEKTQWGQNIEELNRVLLDMLDFSYFADMRFLLFALSNFFLYTWYDVLYLYLAAYANEMNYSETDASILISIIGIVNMFGEIILGWFGDKKYLTAGVIYAICMGFCGFVTALVPLLTSYVSLAIVSGLFGLFIAANYALTSIILVELITIERFTNAYGLLLLIQGVANLVGPPLAGWITDLTGSYDLAFYLSGFFISISGVLMFILPIHGKYKKYRNLKPQISEEYGNVNEETKPSLCNGTSSVITECFANKERIKEDLKINHV